MNLKKTALKIKKITNVKAKKSKDINAFSTFIANK
jgi:hypothetical protein